MKRNTIYYRQLLPNGDSYIATRCPSEWHSAEEILKELEEKGFPLATKKEFEQDIYNRVHPVLSKAIAESDIATMLQHLKYNGNRISFKVFRDITGIKLSPVMKVRLQQLKEYLGNKLTQYEARRAEALAAERAERAAEKERRLQEYMNNLIVRWNSGQWVSNTEFLELCEHYNVKMHPRSKGYVNKKITRVNKHGEYYRLTGANLSEYFSVALEELIAATKESDK